MAFSNLSVDFDGSNDHVVIGDAAPFKFDVGDAFSVSCWFHSTSISRMLVSKLDATSPFPGWEVQILNTGGIIFQIIDDFTANQRAAVNTPFVNHGGWVHVVCTKSTGENVTDLTIYINGFEISPRLEFDDGFVTNGGTSFDTTTPLQIGARDGPNLSVLGNIDDVAIWNKELTPTEVTAIWNNGFPNDLRLNGPVAYLVGYWTMGDGDTFPTLRDRQTAVVTTVSAGVQDRSSNSNDGTPTNMVDGYFRDVITTSETMPDLSGNDNVGTPTNMLDSDFSLDTPGGRSVYSAKLDGVDGYISIGNVTELQFDHTDDFSISCWFKTTLVSTGTLFSKRNGISGTGYQCLLENIAGSMRPRLELEDSSSNIVIKSVSSGDFGDNLWHHVVFTWNGSVGLGSSSANIYIDGALASATGSGTLSTTIDNATEAQIGIRDGTLRPFDGYIDDVSVFNKVLTLPDVQDIYNSGLPNDIRLETPALDGYLAGYWAIGDISAYGISRYITDLDDVDAHINFGNVAALNFAHNVTFSFSCWIKWSTDHMGIVISKIDSTGNVRGYSMSVTTAGPGGAIEVLLRNTITSNEMAVRTTASFNDDNWHHVTFTWNGTVSQSASNASIYVDGISQTLTTVADSLTATISNAASFRIGARDLLDLFYDGMVSDVAVYDVELTSTEVSEIYNNGSPTDNTLLSTEPNLVGYWFLGPDANDGTMTNMVAGDIEADPAQATSASQQLDVNDLPSIQDGYTTPVFFNPDDPHTTPVGGEGFGGGDGYAGIGFPGVTFFMRGIDLGGPFPSYHTWEVLDAPDTDGSEAGPLPFGGPLTEITVIGRSD